MSVSNEENNDVSSDEGSSLDVAVIDQLSDSFLHMNIRNDEELLLQYKMLAFVYNKNYLRSVHFTWVWQEFLVRCPEVPLTGMELKLEFCLRVLADVDKYEYLSLAQRIYFRSRIFNRNVDELLRVCDLKHGVDFVCESEGPSVLPFDVQKQILNARKINIFGKECQTGPISVRGFQETPQRNRSLVELLASVFEIESYEGIKERIIEGMRQNMDFTKFLQKHLETGEESPPHLQTPSDISVNLDKVGTSLPRATPEPPQMQLVSTSLNERPTFATAISSTPVSSHNPRQRRSASQPAPHQRARSPKRANSADRRPKESLISFTERVKARSKPRSRIRL